MDVGKCQHQVLAATLTLFKLGGGQIIHVSLFLKSSIVADLEFGGKNFTVKKIDHSLKYVKTNLRFFGLS